MRHRNGEWRWLHRYATVFARDADGRPTQILGAATDVTALKNAERQLQSLSARLLEVQDEEQRRIARELHDGPSQMLFGIGTTVARIREIPNLPAEAASALAECQAMVDECLRDVRSLSYVLHHPLLDSAGLSAALKWFADGFSRRSGIDVELHIDPALGRLPVAIERDLFRIAQEGLGNVARHSGSRRAAIRLEGASDEVRLQIRDFGCGMHAGHDPGASVPGVGITGMRERLRHLGGHLDLQSSAEGTSLLATVPLVHAPDNPQSTYAR
jgi:signal transduction histidine kinase